ncbi:MAG: energy transducer TonB, partial [Bacteroidetes bacterium]|nr:energy transducer TonB [Bacteroidota bacterium]
ITEEVKEAKKVMTIDIKTLPPPPTIDDTPPPPPLPHTPPPQVRTVEFRIPEPTPENELDPDEDQTITEMEELMEAPAIALENQEGEEEGFFDGEIDVDGDIPEVIVDHEPDIKDFVFAEEEPTPVNINDIKKLIGYPQIARDASIQGMVVVRVLVDKNGNYAKHKVTNEVHPILSRAVEEHVNKLKFTPAIQGGKPIKFWVNIPFNFMLIK